MAGEVKDLAHETARATEDIDHRSEAIQEGTTQMISAIEEISLILHDNGEFQNTIAAAVDEQTATTAEMGQRVNGAANAAEETAMRVHGVAQSVAAVRDRLAGAAETVERMAAMSAALTAQVRNFKV